MTTKPTDGQLPIHAAIVKIMQEIGAIGKDRKNEQQHYSFRGIDDVYNAINPLLGKYGVFTVPEVLETHREEKPTKSGGSMTATHLRIRYTFFAGDGSSIQATVEGEAMDSGDKSTNKAMAVAHKYAILQVFAIPTEDLKDPENESPQSAPAKPKAKGEPKPETKPQPQATTDKDKLANEDAICPIGTKSKGHRFRDVPRTDLQGAVAWAKKNAKEKYADFIQKAEAYLKDDGLVAVLDNPEMPEFGSKKTAALMDLVQNASVGGTLDTVEARSKKHLDEAEISQAQYDLIIGAVRSKREEIK